MYFNYVFDPGPLVIVFGWRTAMKYRCLRVFFSRKIHRICFPYTLDQAFPVLLKTDVTSSMHSGCIPVSEIWSELLSIWSAPSTTLFVWRAPFRISRLAPDVRTSCPLLTKTRSYICPGRIMQWEAECIKKKNALPNSRCIGIVALHQRNELWITVPSTPGGVIHAILSFQEE